MSPDGSRPGSGAGHGPTTITLIHIPRAREMGGGTRPRHRARRPRAGHLPAGRHRHRRSRSSGPGHRRRGGARTEPILRAR
ncbi:hypothetical protein ACFPM0_35645 [Pseudonocardia sulfidoxydans]|uniref:hypothetical protein n=1 Tax=Pseudonocardia sulfidoxydans TaxID=54011 RepID=UPI00361985C6